MEVKEHKIKRLLIANRGEIAIRIHRTANRMGIETLAIYANDDRDALHVKTCDQAALLEGESLAETYLNIQNIIAIAKAYHCDAVHPGYGFLAENADFAFHCKKNGLLFIGPRPELIHMMGNKLEARNLAQVFEAPIIDAISGDIEELLEKKEDLAYPVLVKAAAGGGGKGMRVVRSQEELEDQLIHTAREAKNYFGNGDVYLEAYIENPRHIEVQILADQHGNVVHLWERECSVQRRYQKIIEEAPSPTLTPLTREAIHMAAVRLAKKIGYTNAGTIEFIMDDQQRFYFLEMNTRIQVEHPVTESVTGIDIVEAQLRISQGEQLWFEQEDVKKTGWAIESRIYAENPDIEFMPSPGKMSLYKAPQQPGLRLDTAYVEKGEVSSLYDPMIAKLIVHADNREACIEKMDEALREYSIHGIKTNIPFLRKLVNHQAYQINNWYTSLLDKEPGRILNSDPFYHEEIAAKLAVACIQVYLKEKEPKNVWEEIGFWQQHKNLFYRFHKECIEYTYECEPDTLKVLLDGGWQKLTNIQMADEEVQFLWKDELHKAYFSFSSMNQMEISYRGIVHRILFPFQANDETGYEIDHMDLDGQQLIKSPMPGKIIELMVEEGQQIQKNDTVLIMEAMKMESSMKASLSGKVDLVKVKKGDQVEGDQVLVRIVNEEN